MCSSSIFFGKKNINQTKTQPAKYYEISLCFMQEMKNEIGNRKKLYLNCVYILITLNDFFDEPILGNLEIYPGGGYVTALGRTYRNSVIVLHYLVWTNWLDRLTRSLFIEILLYSPNSNLFNSIRITVEFCTTGYLLRDLNVSINMQIRSIQRNVPIRQTSEL